MYLFSVIEREERRGKRIKMSVRVQNVHIDMRGAWLRKASRDVDVVHVRCPEQT